MDSESLPGSPDRQGAKAAGTSEPWFSYTCPVCGHRDGASLDVGSARRLSCGHYEAVLELSASSSGQEQAAVRVVVDDGGGGTH